MAFRGATARAQSRWRIELFGMEVELRISLPGLVRTEADALIGKAHTVCSYSNATRDNIPVRLVLA
jgi:lipoyl-dependent peroxiredoxin